MEQQENLAKALIEAMDILREITQYCKHSKEDLIGHDSDYWNGAERVCDDILRIIKRDAENIYSCRRYKNSEDYIKRDNYA